MLSILIPTYNNACTPLVQALLAQANGLDVEIVVAEDGTTDAVALASNRWIGEMPHCRYLPLKENRGRAGIRNYLAHEARGNRLLFLDDDVMPAREDFLANYCKATAPVVCGGVLGAKEPHPESLRWQWERAWDEKHPPECRNRNPHDNFATGNFMVQSWVMKKYPFNESIRQYGYEDALFGIELKEDGVEILHIDAAVHHNGLENNALFIKKTEQALVSLSRLPKMQPHAAVACMAMKTRWAAPLLRALTPVMHGVLTFAGNKKSLGSLRIYLLQFYKLCYYHRVIHAG